MIRCSQVSIADQHLPHLFDQSHSVRYGEYCRLRSEGQPRLEESETYTSYVAEKPQATCRNDRYHVEIVATDNFVILRVNYASAFFTRYTYRCDCSGHVMKVKFGDLE